MVVCERGGGRIPHGASDARYDQNRKHNHAMTQASENTAPRNGFPTALLTVLVAALLALGVGLRLAQYAYNRALWLDEAALALNILDRGYGELLGPLDHVQNSPLGFLLSVKALTLLWGTSEYILRLLPLVSGVISVFLFWALARSFAREEERCSRESLTVLFALVFFAPAKHLIYFASELRHYSTDVALVCLLLWLAMSIRADDPWRKGLGAFCIAGLISVWFSLAAILLIAGVGVTIMVSSAARKEWRHVAAMAVVCILCAAAFYGHLQIHERNIAARNLGEEIEVGNAMSWMPLPPTSLSDLKWFRGAFDFFFYFPGGLTYRGLGGFAFLAGCLSLWHRKREYLGFMILPIGFALLASGLHRYPFRDRYVLFLAPCLFLLIAEGITFLMERRHSTARVLGVVLFVMLAAQPFYHGLKVFANPRSGYEIKPLLAHLAEHRQPGDVIYISWMEGLPYHYYAPRFGLSDLETIEEPRDIVLAYKADAYREEQVTRRLETSPRVWILAGHDTRPPFAIAPGSVDVIGFQESAVTAEGAALYLYGPATGGAARRSAEDERPPPGG